MHRHYNFEFEELVAGHGGYLRRHGEVTAESNETDVGSMDLLDKGHVGKDVCNADMVGRTAFGLDDDAGALTEVKQVAGQSSLDIKPS